MYFHKPNALYFQCISPFIDMSILECNFSDDGSQSEFSPGGGKMKSSKHNSRPGKEDKICAVCGDKALGCNFDAISCESCKAFFRRNAFKESVRF